MASDLSAATRARLRSRIARWHALAEEQRVIAERVHYPYDIPEHQKQVASARQLLLDCAAAYDSYVTWALALLQRDE
jgi:hypothetical protein